MVVPTTTSKLSHRICENLIGHTTCGYRKGGGEGVRNALDFHGQLNLNSTAAVSSQHPRGILVYNEENASDFSLQLVRLHVVLQIPRARQARLVADISPTRQTILSRQNGLKVTSIRVDVDTPDTPDFLVTC